MYRTLTNKAMTAASFALNILKNIKGESYIPNTVILLTID